MRLGADIDMAAHLYVGCVESERGRDHLGDVPLQQRREALRPGHLPEPGQVVAWRKDLLLRHASDVLRLGLFIREWTFGSKKNT